jgi:hypothetical protein
MKNPWFHERGSSYNQSDDDRPPVRSMEIGLVSGHPHGITHVRNGVWWGRWVCLSAEHAVAIADGVIISGQRDIIRDKTHDRGTRNDGVGQCRRNVANEYV